ncbi:MAG: hypothetical protein ACI94Y_001787 [Maribacter sp.]|jgi:hypothetical protein
MKVQYGLCFFLFVFFIPCKTNAQISAGVHAGVSIFKIRNYIDVEIAQQETKVLKNYGIFIGLPIEKAISEHFSFQIEPSFIRKGNIFVIVPEDVNAYGDYLRKRLILDYIGSALLINKRFSLEGNQSIRIGTGIDLSFLLAGKTVTSWSNKENEQDLAWKFGRDDYKWNRLDAAWLGDISLLTETKVGYFVVGFRGMVDIIPNHTFKGKRPSEQAKTYNWGMMIYSGYIIPDRDDVARKIKI